MKPSSSKLREIAELPRSLDRRLRAYALSASAAGVGVLALAHPAEAEIVYTRAHILIGHNGSYNLDLNHDGITDFTIADQEGGGTCTTDMCQPYFGTLAAMPVKGNGVDGFVFDRPWAFALKAGARIGSSRYFNGLNMAVVAGFPSATSYRNGGWINVKNRYLGLKFKIKGKTHYGWARLTVMVNAQKVHIITTLTGYAYETIPGKAIKAGQTKASNDETIERPNASFAPAATLGKLALGAPALSIRRRD